MTPKTEVSTTTAAALGGVDPVGALLGGLAGDLGASRWILAIEREGAWVAESAANPHLDDLYLQLAQATSEPAGIEHHTTTELGSAGMRLDAAGVREVAVAVLEPGRAIAFLEGADKRKVAAVEASWAEALDRLKGVLPGVMESAWRATELTGIARWIPTLRAMARGDLEQPEVLETLGVLLGAKVLVAFRLQGETVEAVGAWRTEAGKWNSHESVVTTSGSAPGDPHDLLGSVTASLGMPIRTDHVVASTDEARPLALGLAGGRHSEEGARIAATMLSAASRRHRDLSAAKTNALLQERARIASMIHEGITQVLTNVVLQMEVLDRVLDDPAAARKMLASLRTAILEALDSLRGAILELTPAAPEWSDLVGGLERFATDFGAQWGIEVAYSVEGKARDVDPEVLALVFGFVQEGLSNVRKHAGVDRAEISLSFDAGSVSVSVLDEGPGFDPERAAEEGYREHQGLAIMRSRARLAGAQMQVESAPGAGTRVTLGIPA